MQSANPKIVVDIVPTPLSTETREAMWALYHRFYHYDKVQFMQRINTNNYYSFYTTAGRVVGFTGLRINRTSLEGKKQFLIYFGQTVIDPAFRGQALIPRTAVKLCLKFWRSLLVSDLYFWADALTYKAYLVFAKTVPVMYPSWKCPTPVHIKSIIDHLGSIHYKANYCEASGTVIKESILVNDTTTHIPTKYRQDADIRFFTEANPRYVDGHGLLTITQMTRKNILALVYKCVKKALPAKKGNQQVLPQETVITYRGKDLP